MRASSDELPSTVTCSTCNGTLRPLLIAPTHRKDFRNPPVSQVWYEAEQLLRGAGRVVFVGYRLPEDDVEVVYLFKRSLAHLPSDRMTVVEYDPTNASITENQVGRRYRTLFGDRVDWQTVGMEHWVNRLEKPAAKR